MTGMSQITTKGQVTIPIQLRDYFNMLPGDTIYFDLDRQKKAIKVRKLKSKSVTDELYGSMANPAIPYKPMEEVRKIAGIALAKKYGLVK